MGSEVLALAEEIKRMSEKLDDLYDFVINARIGNDESKLSIHKCSICFGLKKLDKCVINSPCGHCFCETVRFLTSKYRY